LQGIGKQLLSNESLGKSAAVAAKAFRALFLLFFKKQAENLLEMDHNKILEYKNTPEKFEEVKNSLLGNIIKVIGRVNKNELFDRMEFVARLVFPNPDPQEEIEVLKKELENKPAGEIKVKEEPKKLPSFEDL